MADIGELQRRIEVLPTTAPVLPTTPAPAPGKHSLCDWGTAGEGAGPVEAAGSGGADGRRRSPSLRRSYRRARPLLENPQVKSGRRRRTSISRLLILR